MFDESSMRARFWELMTQKEKIQSEAKPARDEYEATVREMDAIRERQKPIIAKFKAIEEPLVSVDTEMAMLARALKGEVGKRPQ